MNEKPFLNFYQKSRDRNVKLVSIDVFDTLLFRNTLSEPELFYQISKKFSNFLRKEHNTKIHVDDLFYQRLWSAKYAYRLVSKNNFVREADYRTIIENLLKTCRLDAAYYQDYERIELNHEIKNLILNKQLAEYLLQLKQSHGKKIIAISDMYLNSDHINKLISSKPHELIIDRIYSSSEFGTTKASGELFHRVAELESTKFSEWTHCGDNYRADYKNPTGLGIISVYTPRNPLWRIKTRLNRKKFHLANKLAYL